MSSGVRHHETTMLAQILAIAIVVLAILGLGYFLWQFARKRGDLAETFAWIILVAAVLLMPGAVCPGPSQAPNSALVSSSALGASCS
nr:putative integron gene cassette protein [uncultured bacterium]